MAKLKSFNIAFIGKTGYGKSSLINCLFGTHFNTDPEYSCTKELYTVSTVNGVPEGTDLLTIIDTPGIAEFTDNTFYQKYYDHAVSMADVIVLVVTMKRDDADEQEFLLELKKHLPRKRKPKFVVALNQIDRTAATSGKNATIWCEDTNTPSDECYANIEERKRVVCERFSLFLPPVPVAVSAMRNYGIEELKETILN